MLSSRKNGIEAEGEIARIGRCLGEDFAAVALVATSHLADAGQGILGSTLGHEVHVRPGLPPAMHRLVLAHELAHIAQRHNAARGRGRLGSLAELEEEADRAALAAAAGRRFDCVLADIGSGARPWAEAGHYYTCYFVLLAAGVDQDTAAKQACLAQMPDQVNEFDATARGKDWMARSTASMEASSLAWLEQRTLEEDIDVQRGLHCLTGGNAEAETARRRSVLERAAFDSFEFGLALHPFGDSYAHRTLSNPKVLYVAPLGHLFDKHKPDQIHARPDLYVRYGQDLYDIVVAKQAGKPRLDRNELGVKLRSFAAISSEPNENAQITQIKMGVVIGDASTPNASANFVLTNGYTPEREEPTSWVKYRGVHGFGPQMLADTMGFAKKWSVPGTS